MTTVAILSLVSLLGWLLLVSRNPEIRTLGLSRGVIIFGVWVAVFVIVAIVMTQIMG